jgi:nuclear transport factor 2 (NTF2) superfamily protein
VDNSVYMTYRTGQVDRYVYMAKVMKPTPHRKTIMTMTTAIPAKPPVPPFTDESATLKVRLAENAWNSRDPQVVAQAYSIDSVWRNRSVFVTGREQIIDFLSGKWEREHEYRLIKELWAHSENRIAVRFAYEYHDDAGQWFRAYGNENWLYNEHGLMTHRHASINDVQIDEDERKFFWDQNAPRPEDHPSLSDLGL